jgi:DNA-binding NarL/FixJ family response regulator
VQLRAAPASRPSSVRLAVISDERTLAARVTRALERDGLGVTVEVAADSLVALERAVRRPTLVVVGHVAVRVPAERMIHRARQHLPRAVVIAILRERAGGDAARLLASGADALLLDRDVDVAVATAFRAAAAGQVCVPADLRQVLEPTALSHRERQILGLAVAGFTNAQIATRLVLAESTVKTHLSSAFRRLGVHSRREAAALVLASDDVLRRSVLTTLRLSDAFPLREELP